MTHPIYQSPKDGRELADVQQKVEKLGLGVLEDSVGLKRYYRLIFLTLILITHFIQKIYANIAKFKSFLKILYS